MTQDGGETKRDVPAELSLKIYHRHVIDGKSPESIAEEHSIGLADVLGDIERVESALTAEFTDKLQKIRTRHTARLEAIFVKALAGYERSCEDDIVHKRTAQGDQASESEGGARGRGTVDRPKLKVETVTRRKSGNARFLWEARAALADIRRLWGIDPATTMRNQNEDAMAHDDLLSSASDEELASLITAGNLLARLTEQSGVGKMRHGGDGGTPRRRERLDTPKY